MPICQEQIVSKAPPYGLLSYDLIKCEKSDHSISNFSIGEILKPKASSTVPDHIQFEPSNFCEG